MRCMGSLKTLEFRFLFRAKQMAFGQGVVVRKGYWSCPAMQCGATVTTALTHHLPCHTYPHSSFLVIVGKDVLGNSIMHALQKPQSMSRKQLREWIRSEFQDVLRSPSVDSAGNGLGFHSLRTRCLKNAVSIMVRTHGPFRSCRTNSDSCLISVRGSANAGSKAAQGNARSLPSPDGCPEHCGLFMPGIWMFPITLTIHSSIESAALALMVGI
mmetsp:Transcript_65159/g.109182  ORF Transcript_65159/g.109182 Transcript_65159/m.109182 type:complete len:213 (-) Transcript_65159:130-768(-)